MNRREMLQKSFQAAAALIAGSTIAPFKLFANESNTEALSLLTGNPLRFPPTIDGGDMTLAQSNVVVWPNTATEVIAINGVFPGPTIRIQKGNTFTAQFHNQLTVPSTVHWHGLHVPENMDGHPKDAVPPGGSYTYTFPVNQKAGTYFYHAHPHMQTGLQVYKGFAGFFIIDDPDELSLGLPAGDYDIPLVIQDRRAATQPQFTYNPDMMDLMTGFLGDLPLVNGTPEAFFEVSRTLYRFRLLNGSNARVYQIAFSDNHPFQVIGSDGGLIDAPIQITDIYLSPGERVDILVDFSSYSLGQSVTLKSLYFPGGGMGQYQQGTEMDLLRLDVTRSDQSGGIIPASLTPINYYDPSGVVTTRTFTLSMVMGGSGMHRINNLVFDLNRIDEEVPLGDLEEWRIVNLTDEFHPMHVHALQFQVLERNGNPNLPAVDRGWKDTVLVNPNETVRLLIRFTEYTGIYLFHCHNLEHEDDGMMLNFRVNPSTAIGDEDNSFPENHVLYPNYPNPFNPSTTIKYQISPQTTAEDLLVNLKVRDSLGREVTTLVNQKQHPGSYEVVFDGSGLASGIYYCTLKVGRFSQTRKMILEK